MGYTIYMKRYTKYFWALFLAVLLIPSVGLAKGSSGGPDTGGGGTDSGLGKLENPIKANNITDFIKDILDVVIMIGTPLVVLAIIYCGFRFVQARGNPAEITKAKEALLWTLVGAAILLGSWVLAQALADTVKCISGTINC